MSDDRSLLAHPAPQDCKGLEPLEDGHYRCRKCGSLSGDDWSQCDGECPVAQSPHYNPSCEWAFQETPLLEDP